MNIEQIYTGCLAQAAYYIESNGEAAVIDPLRDTAAYIQRAANSGAQIKYIFETHFHADFVSGHLDLAAATGAEIVYGPMASPGFTAHIATDGEVFRVGALTFTVLHTPGHTMESTCYLLRTDDKAIGLFSGDTLFIGDVGRPDLAGRITASQTSEKLAGLLYDSLHEKICPLPDDLVIYPGHGAGSACGKNMSRETTDTLGHQKAVNYALQPMDKATFIDQVTTGLTNPPAYFPFNVLLNRQGYENMDVLKERGLKALSPDAFAAEAETLRALILDTRDPEQFVAGFIPGALNIGLNGSFAPWAGALLPDINQPILVVAAPGKEAEVIIRLARVGFGQVAGYLDGGMDAWMQAGRETDAISSISAAAFADKLREDPETIVLDVRKQSEYATRHVAGALNMPLDYIHDIAARIAKDEPVYVYCAGGYRSVIFVSIMREKGYTNLVDVQGGFKAIETSDAW